MSDILFSAPFSFIKKNIKKVKKKKFLFKEIWNSEDLFFSSTIKAWIVNPGQKFVVNEKILNFFPNLEVIASPSTGSNHINLKDCKKKNIKFFSLLSNRKRLSEIRASSEFTFLLILNSLRKIQNLKSEILNSRWRDKEDYMRGEELYSKKVGIVGLGRIGSNIASWCKAFGSEIFYYDPYKSTKRFKKVSLKNIFVKSDIVVISTVLNNTTKGMINFKYFKLMKENSHLINTSRGEVLAQDDLVRFLSKSKKNISFNCDVLANEVKGKPLNKKLIDLYRNNKLFITPHIAGATYESQTKAAEIVLEMINKFYETN
jgi:D-3-phosphoglycerate dehydrogenase